MLVDNQTLIGQITPTVYIDRIVLETTKASGQYTDGLRVTLNLVVKDKLNAKFKSTWFGNKDLTKFIKIKVIQTTNQNIHNSLSDRTNNSIATFSGGSDTVVKTMSLMSVDAEIEGFHNQHTETDIDGNTITNFNYRLSFELENPKPKILSYFCFSYIDPEQFRDIIGVSLPSNFVSLNGKVSSDIVFRTKDEAIGPELVSLASAFYDDRNIVWPGPVHQMDNGRWMTGFEHSSKNSKYLTERKVPNIKIQDFRVFHQIATEPIDLSVLEPIGFKYGKKPKILRNDETDVYKKQNYFSNAWVSQDSSNNVHFIFGANIGKLIRYKARFGKLIDNTKPAIVNEIIKGCKIKSFKIFRRRVKNVPGINCLGSSDYYNERFDDIQKSDDLIVITGEQEQTIFKDTEGGSVKEINSITPMNNNSSGFCKYFSISDRQLKDVSHGLYQYGIELLIEDGTTMFLKNKLAKLIQGRKLLKLYFQEAGLEYNSIAQKYSEKFITNQNQNNIKPWITSFAIYLEALQALTNTELTEGQRVAILGILEPATGNLDGLRGFISTYDKLISTVQNLLGDSPSLRSSQGMLAMTNEVEKPSYILGTPKYPPLLECNNWFTNVTINTNNLGDSGISYFGGISGTSFRTISAEDFKNKRDNEREKYNISDRNLDISSTGLQESAQRDAYIQAHNNAGKGFQYLSPSYIRIGKVIQDTTSPQDLEESQEIESSILNINNSAITSLGVRIASIYEQDPIATIYQPTSLQETAHSINTPSLVQRRMDPLVESNKITSPLANPNIDMLNRQLHIAVGNNFEISTSPGEIDWSLIQKIEVFTSFEVSNIDGNKMLKAENWETLTQELYEDARFGGKILLCRLVPYSNHTFDIRYNNNLELPIYNKHFLLNGPPVTGTEAIIPPPVEDLDIFQIQHEDELRSISELFNSMPGGLMTTNIWRNG